MYRTWVQVGDVARQTVLAEAKATLDRMSAGEVG